MTRRGKRGSADAIVDLVALLPWWGGVALAIVTYLLLHRAATPDVAAKLTAGNMGGFVSQSLWRSLASVGQYIVPFLCVLGAAISAFRRHQRKSLIAEVAASPAADALDGMSWKEFELLVGESFRAEGYQVAEIGFGGPDGGVDLVLRKGSEKFLVQCKQWKAFTVGVAVVRELYGVMAAKGATGGFVVTSGRFTKDATEFASGRNIELIDGPQLKQRIQRDHRTTGDQRNEARATPSSAPSMQSASSATPLCPVCAKPMVQRLAKRGSNAGKPFWGCSGYPGCKGTRESG